MAWAVDKMASGYKYYNVLLKSSKSAKELKELKNKAVLNLKQYCIRCYVVLSNIF